MTDKSAATATALLPRIDAVAPHRVGWELSDWLTPAI